MKRSLIGLVAAGTFAALSAAPVSAAGDTVVPGRVHISLSRHAHVPASGEVTIGVPPYDLLPLQYRGGQVEQAGTTSYAIFWEPAGSFVSPSYNGLIQRYFNDIGGTKLYSVASQYYQTTSGPKQYIANSSRLGGAWVDTAAYPSATVSDADIQNEVVRAIHANGWTAGVGHQFFVFTAKGENSCRPDGSCSFTTYCAYHGYFSLNGVDVLYADQPYTGTDLAGCGTPTSPNGDADADSTINVVSHEHMETVTDPNLDAWGDAIGQEIGDKCNFSFGNQDSRGADVYLHGHPYIVQQEFSNRFGRCTLDGSKTLVPKLP